MTPLREPSTGALVKRVRVPEKVLESVRRVEDAAVVMVLESVAPSNARPEPMRRVFTPETPFPARIPESVVLPVPPYTPESVEVADTTPLIAWRGPVSEPMVREPVAVKFVEVAFVVDALDAWKVPGKMTCDGSESVSAPVAPEVVIWFAVPASDVTNEVEVAIW
jgi:hypothetical protein